MHLKGLILVFLIFICATQKAAGKSYQDFDTASEELADIQRVVEATLPDIETALKTKGGFKPFAVVILANDSMAEIDVPDSVKTGYTEEDLKEELSIDALRGVYKVVVIFYTGTATDPSTGKPAHTVAIFAEHTNDDFAYLFYYPYKITSGNVVFGDSFGDLAPQVMFKPD